MNILVVTAALFLAHDNAEVERGFSDGGKTVTVNRNRHSEASVSNLRIATDESKCLAVCHNSMF